MTFDPESYTISIRKENHDGEMFYVGRVAEFPNISSFEDNFEEARTLVIDAIQTLKKIADETQADFPVPYPVPSEEFSGRVTLRLPKTLHAKVSRKAAQEETSVNQFLVTAIATYVGEVDGITKVVLEASSLLSHFINHAVTNVLTSVASWKTAPFLQSETTTTKYIDLSNALNKGYEVIQLQSPIGVTR